MTENFDDAPYRAFAFDWFSAFFRGTLDDNQRARWQDVLAVTGALSGRTLAVELPETLEIEKAFATAFYGASAETVPLAQSCWENEKQLYNGPAAAKCRTLYARYGLVNESDVHLPDDHIGIALAFLSELIRRGEVDAEKSFLLYGIASWWPKAEAVLRTRSEWAALGRVLTVFTALLDAEKARFTGE